MNMNSLRFVGRFEICCGLLVGLFVRFEFGVFWCWIIVTKVLFALYLVTSSSINRHQPAKQRL